MKRLKQISNDELIREYYDGIKKDFPDVSLEQVKDAISNSFKYAKSEMEKDDFPIIRMKYLGSFRVFQKSLTRKDFKEKRENESKN